MKGIKFSSPGGGASCFVVINDAVITTEEFSSPGGV